MYNKMEGCKEGEGRRNKENERKCSIKNKKKDSSANENNLKMENEDPYAKLMFGNNLFNVKVCTMRGNTRFSAVYSYDKDQGLPGS